MKFFLSASAVALCASTVLAFTPPKDSAGPLTVEIGDPGEIKSLGDPVAVPVTLRNSSDALLNGSVVVSVADDWSVVGEATRSCVLPAKGTQTIPFRVVPGKDSYAALYPVHARALFTAADGVSLNAHPILLCKVAPDAVSSKNSPAAAPSPLRVPKRGPLRLDAATAFQVSIAVHNKPVVIKPEGWQGADKETGTSIGFADTDRGGFRRAMNVHPPYRVGWGDAMVDWRIALPANAEISFETATAIRDADPKKEGVSDGVEFKVQVSPDGEHFQTLFERMSAAKAWTPVLVDLSPFAGREVTFRLLTSPGPAHNTSCDSSFWAEPTIWAGRPIAAEADADRKARREKALAAAKTAFKGDRVDWAWKLESEAGTTGVAVEPGPNGIADAFIALTDSQRDLVFDGFNVEIDGVPVAKGASGRVCEKVERRLDPAGAVLTHQVLKGDQVVPVEAKFWAEKGALRLAFSMPGVERDLRGEPRFTALSIGAASQKARRVYAGFGNVIQDPGRFELHGGGFTLSTRHIGLDFPNGLSLVQACGIFPDRLSVDSEKQQYALVTHHDSSFSFVPSQRGAFAAARVYREIAGFQPAGGVAKLQGRICLDQWGGDYRKAANDLEKAGRYGLTDAVFVKHDWQRWGYDYRLPEIFPPRGNFTDFCAMVDTAKKHGILFCPHDNYIDFYPDAEGYSYDHIIFNRDGTPQKAWFNEGRDALSYRWLPTAFFPWLENNLQQMKTGFAPTSCFVDVFTAIPPIDFYDRQGRFYPKMVSAECWGKAFDRIREVFGDNAPTLSEAGADSLIGHLDGGESDHSAWLPELESKKRDAHFRWRMPAADGERVPWHDMVSHGKFVLLAGGLGPRYAGGDDPFLHGYGSDDYLSLTVLGGRNPMCDGPFSRRAVMTYWLLHGVCAELARGELLEHRFTEDDIHRQSVRFSNGFAHVNRGKTDWQIEGLTLPRYGFVAKAGPVTASIARREGVVSAFAMAQNELFADARPPALDTPSVRTKVAGVEDLGKGSFRVRIEWEVLRPVASEARPFLHFDKADESKEEIAFQGFLKLDPAKFAQPGVHPSEAVVALSPEQAKSGSEYLIRYGLYVPHGGERLPLDSPLDSGRRAKGGHIQVQAGKDGQVAVHWEVEPQDPNGPLRAERLNLAEKVVDFGPVATNGAFRMRPFGGGWELTPLPDSLPFKVSLDLAKLGSPGRKITAATAIDADGNPAGEIKVRMEGGKAIFDVDGKAFAYRLR